MDYLGEKDGANVYRDRNTGIFYVDDGARAPLVCGPDDDAGQAGTCAGWARMDGWRTRWTLSASTRSPRSTLPAVTRVVF